MKRRSFLQFLGLAPAAPLLPRPVLPEIPPLPAMEVVHYTEGPETVVSGCTMTCLASASFYVGSTIRGSWVEIE